jgi:hypothetical protein
MGIVHNEGFENWRENLKILNFIMKRMKSANRNVDCSEMIKHLNKFPRNIIARQTPQNLLFISCFWNWANLIELK